MVIKRKCKYIPNNLISINKGTVKLTIQRKYKGSALQITTYNDVESFTFEVEGNQVLKGYLKSMSREEPR